MVHPTNFPGRKEEGNWTLVEGQLMWRKRIEKQIPVAVQGSLIPDQGGWMEANCHECRAAY